MKDNQAYQKATQKVKMVKEFYSHLLTYLIFNGFMFVINYATSPGDWWVLYPVIGWGFCLTIHAIDLYINLNNWSKSWEERKIKEFMQKEFER